MLWASIVVGLPKKSLPRFCQAIEIGVCILDNYCLHSVRVPHDQAKSNRCPEVLHIQDVAINVERFEQTLNVISQFVKSILIIVRVRVIAVP